MVVGGMLGLSPVCVSEQTITTESRPPPSSNLAHYVLRRAVHDVERSYSHSSVGRGDFCVRPGLGRSDFSRFSLTCDDSLGARERPVPKRRKGQYPEDGGYTRQVAEESEEEVDETQFEDDDWASVVAPRGMLGAEASGSNKVTPPSRGLKGPKKRSGYFSDESDDDA